MVEKAKKSELGFGIPYTVDYARQYSDIMAKIVEISGDQRKNVNALVYDDEERATHLLYKVTPQGKGFLVGPNAKEYIVSQTKPIVIKDSDFASKKIHLHEHVKPAKAEEAIKVLEELVSEEESN